MNLMGFGEGWNRAEERNLRNRQDLAKAFEEFKRNNPYATYADYQSFIDNMSGGSNWLRGGAPGKDVLEALANQNAETKRRDTLTAQLNAVKQRAEVNGLLDASVNDYLMNYSGSDWDKAYTDYAAQFGPDGDNALMGTNIRSRFNQQYRDRLVGSRVLELTPRAVEYLKSLGGNVTSLDSAAFANALGVPESMASPLITAAKAQYDREVADWTLRNNGTIINTINTEIAAGRDPKAAVSTLLQGSGISIDQFDFNAAKAEADRIRGLEDTQREREQAERRATAIRDLESTFRTDPAIQAAMRRGDEAAVTGLMLTRAKRYLTDEQFLNVYGVEKGAANASIFSEVFKSEASEAVNTQILGQQQRQDSAAAAASTAREDWLKTNISEAQTFFKNAVGDAAGAVAANIAQSYDLTNQGARMALLKAFSEVPDDLKKAGDTYGIMNFVTQHPDFVQATGGRPNVTASADRRYQTVLGTQGGFNVESFQSWVDRTNNEIASTMSAAQTNFQDALKIEDPAQRKAVLEQMSRQLQAWGQQVEVTVGQRRQRADRWVEFGTGGWSDNAIEGNNGAILDRTRGMSAALQTQIEAELNRLNAPPPPAAAGNNPNAPSTTQSPVSSTLQRHQEYNDAEQAIAGAAGFAVQNSSAWNPITGAYDAIAAIPRWLYREGVSEPFLQSAAEGDRADAMREYLSSNGGAHISVYNALPPEGRRQFLRDVQTMNPTEFQAKYQEWYDKRVNGEIYDYAK